MRRSIDGLVENVGAATDKRSRSSEMRILSLSCVYPSPRNPALGLFVQSRLRCLSRMAQVKVIAPVAEIDYAVLPRLSMGRGKVPAREWDAKIEVLRPLWLYLPGGLAINAVLLFLRLLPIVFKVRKTFDFDLIDAHFAFPDGIAAGLLAGCVGVPFSITLRGNETMHAKKTGRRKLMAWALRRASRVIVLSERLRKFALSAGVDDARVRTIPNGVDPEIFYPHDRRICREKFGLIASTRTILSAGTLIQRKGHHHIVKAVSELRKNGIPLELLIAGGAGREGDYEKAIRKQIIDLGLTGSVRLCGEVSPEELAELMSAADVFCLASTREGWPNVLQEAMACGAPVVATDVGAVKEMVPSRDYGLVVPANDSNALTQAVAAALGRDWDRGALSRWAHSRTWEHAAQETFSELKSVAATRRKKKG
jgi:teichuronic acid biosynthesis glycosyltransferase TuaC